MPRLPRRVAAYAFTGWEIHPVTRIGLRDDSFRTFVEYPR